MKAVTSVAAFYLSEPFMLLLIYLILNCLPDTGNLLYPVQGGKVLLLAPTKGCCSFSFMYRIYAGKDNRVLACQPGVVHFVYKDLEDSTVWIGTRKGDTTLLYIHLDSACVTKSTTVKTGGLIGFCKKEDAEDAYMEFVAFIKGKNSKAEPLFIRR